MTQADRPNPCLICGGVMSVWRDGPSVRRDPATCLLALRAERDEARARAAELEDEIAGRDREQADEEQAAARRRARLLGPP